MAVAYESLVIPYDPPAVTRKYTPDFPLPNGIIVETKGRFTTEDRQKHKHIKAQHPELDIRFVFSDSKAKLTSQKNKEFVKWLKSTHNITCSFNRIPDRIDKQYREAFWETLKTKPSQTSYADWCEKNGFLYADVKIPDEWLKEPACRKRLAAIERIAIKKNEKRSGSK